MGNLIRIELYKLLKGTASKVLAGVAAGYALLIVGTYQLMDLLFEETGISAPEMPGMPESFRLTGLDAFAAADLYTLIQIFMLVLIASLFTSEYGRSTWKVMLVSGTSRSRLYLAKFAVLAVFLAGYALLSGVFVTGLASALNGWGAAFELKHILQIGAAALRVTMLNLVYASLLTILALLTKSTGIIIAIGIGVQFAESMLFTLIQMADHVVLDIAEKLLPSGYAVPYAARTVDTDLLVQGLSGSVVLIAVALWIGIRVFRRQDIPV